MADSAEGPSLAPMVAALERAPKPVTAKEWRFVVTFAAAERRTDLQLHDRLEPCLVQFVSRFPAREVRPDTLRIRYMLIAIKQTDVPLERVNGSGRKGRSGAAIWEEIAPALHL